MKRFSLISLGCPKNLVDSEYFKQIFLDSDIVYTENEKQADYVLINTCGFINPAKEESINTILEYATLKDENKKQKLIVTGCLVKRYMDTLKNEIPEVDYWIGLKDFDLLKSILKTENATDKRAVLTPKHYAYLRVSDGCNNHCAYCAIPSIRGDLQSESLESMVKQAKELADQGVKELIINAQDTAQYGTDLYKKQMLIDLLHEIHKIEGLKWIRLLYLHPAHINFEMLDELAKMPKLCHYFDIPIQHINDEILTSMNRHTNKAHIISVLKYIRKIMPDAVLRTSLITGFPGEDIKKFNELIKFIEDIKFDKLGVFSYSPEEGTPAIDFPKQITQKTAEKRRDKIMMLQQVISTDNLIKFIGQKLDVIIEKESAEAGYQWEARSQYDAPDIDGIVYVVKANAQIGDIIRVKIVESWEYDLVAEEIRLV